MKRCTGCGIDLVPILLREDFKYASSDAKPSIWDGHYPVAGTIRAYMCPECGLVSLYAAVPKDSLPIPSAPSAPETGDLPIASRKRGEE